MRRVTVFCDRCGKAFNVEAKEMDNRNLKLIDFQEDQYDICSECYKDLERWFDDPKKEGDLYEVNRC